MARLLGANPFTVCRVGNESPTSASDNQGTHHLDFEAERGNCLNGSPSAIACPLRAVHLETHGQANLLDDRIGKDRLFEGLMNMGGSTSNGVGRLSALFIALFE